MGVNYEIPNTPDLDSSSYDEFSNVYSILKNITSGQISIIQQIVNTGIISQVPATGELVSNVPNYDPAIPAAPTGLVVTSGLTSNYLNWNTVTDPKFALMEIWRSTTNSLTSATYLDSTTTNFYADPVGLTQTTYYYWIRIQTRAQNTGPYNAGETGGTPGTTSKVGSSDLFDLIITSQKLASGSITLDKFGTGLRPIQIGSVLPTLPDPNFPLGSLFFLTTNSTLFRSTGTTWTQDTAATTITGTLVAGQIGAGQINGTHIAANSITAAGAQIAALAVGTAAIQDLAVTNGKIASLAADKITAGTITAAISIQAPTITGATITGSLFKTADSGQRAELSVASGFLDFFDSGGAVRSRIGYSSLLGVQALVFGDGLGNNIGGSFRTDAQYAVYAQAITSGWGVYGVSSSGYGVHGSSTYGVGLFGTSSSSYGIYGSSTTNIGIYGITGAASSFGVYGTSNFGAAVGVRGAADSNIGVHGTSNSSFGVRGDSTTYIGIYGTSDSNVGVYGISNSNFGVRGVSASGMPLSANYNPTRGSLHLAVTANTTTSAPQEGDIFLRSSRTTPANNGLYIYTWNTLGTALTWRRLAYV